MYGSTDNITGTFSTDTLHISPHIAVNKSAASLVNLTAVSDSLVRSSENEKNIVYKFASVLPDNSAIKPNHHFVHSKKNELHQNSTNYVIAPVQPGAIFSNQSLLKHTSKNVPEDLSASSYVSNAQVIIRDFSCFDIIFLHLK